MAKTATVFTTALLNGFDTTVSTEERTNGMNREREGMNMQLKNE